MSECGGCPWKRPSVVPVCGDAPALLTNGRDSGHDLSELELVEYGYALNEYKRRAYGEFLL